MYLQMLGPLPSNWIYGYLNSTLIFTNRIVEKLLPISNFERIPCNQTAWMQAFTAPRYLASTEDSAMATCFLLDQQMGPPPNMNTYPEVEFRSIESPTQ